MESLQDSYSSHTPRLHAHLDLFLGIACFEESERDGEKEAG